MAAAAAHVKRTEDVIVARGRLGLVDEDLDEVGVEGEGAQRHRVLQQAAELLKPQVQGVELGGGGAGSGDAGEEAAELLKPRQQPEVAKADSGGVGGASVVVRAAVVASSGGASPPAPQRL